MLYRRGAENAVSPTSNARFNVVPAYSVAQSQTPVGASHLMRSVLLAAASAVLLVPSFALAQSRAVPTPASVIGFEPGTDRKLPEWRQVVSYFQALDAASPRIQLHTLGKTTLGRPFIAAFIGDPAT